MAKYKFRLLDGLHTEEPTFERDEKGAPIIENGTPRILKEGRTFKKGDIIETDKNLHVIFDRIGNPPKFEEVHEDERIMTAQEKRQKAEALLKEAADDELAAQLRKNTMNDVLDSMSVEDLRKHAASEEIDLGKAKSKDEILKVIKAAMVAV